MSLPAPFDYIQSGALQSIITCMISNRYNKSHLSITLQQYLQRESEAAANTGFLEVDAREWSECSSFDLLDQFAQMKLLQVIRPRVQGQPRMIRIPTKLPRGVIIIPARIGESIRNWLLLESEGYPYAFWLLWKRVRTSSSYAAVVRYFHVLEKIGLIEKANPKKYTFFTDKYRGSTARIFYKIVDGMQGSPDFDRADIVLYPSHEWGGRRYKKAKSQGRVVKGRNKEFD